MNDECAGASRRSFLGGLIAAAAAGAAAPVRANAPLAPLVRSAAAWQAHPAQAAGNAVPEARAILEAARLGGQASFALAEARSGRILESFRADQAMSPASITKSITALYALEALGPGFRFRTRLIATGPLRNGRIEGDLVLAGSGDPTLVTDDLAAMAAALRAAGIREVAGRFAVFGRALPYIRAIDPEQPDHVGYNPSVAGLNLNFNRVHFEWTRRPDGYEVAMDARSESLRPPVTVARIRVADRVRPSYSYADRDGADHWTVARAALGDNGSRWLPVRRPIEYTGEVFQVLAGAQGIALGRPEPVSALPQGTVIVEHASEHLGGVLAEMMKFSTNLTAEALGLSASGALGAAPRTLGASGRRMADWAAARLGVSGARFVDHSGLGVGSRISAADMVGVLVRSGPDGALNWMLKRVDMKDAQGRRIANHPAQVVAKTGTLNFVSGLAGYLRTPSNAVLAFAIFTGDLERRRALRGEEMERPPGGRDWANRARAMQQRLLERWVAVYSG